jgi:hypothetical protein
VKFFFIYRGFVSLELDTVESDSSYFNYSYTKNSHTMNYKFKVSESILEIDYVVLLKKEEVKE